jgi:photosystem II stability/assembly factor-like uncharacterized protein
LVVSFCFCLFLSLGAAKNEKKSENLFTSAVIEGLEWRNIGPANMGGRIDDFAVVESNPFIIYAATASGGIWKTTNNGVTWKPIFDDQSTSTIGDIAIAPSNPDIIWAGTGEPNNRQSSSWGNGVYKSMDGGHSWTNMGLQDTHHIGRIVIHPTNPDIVYVAALGHLWGANKERGLYRTTDGGTTWANTNFIDENTGFIDVAMDPESPNTLYAASYQRRRRGWGFNGGGPGSGLYKTTDGGETWDRLTNGLPKGDIGRIGIDIYRNNPNIVYAVVEHRNEGTFRSEDKGLTWRKMSGENPRPMYYSQIRIDPNNDQRIWVMGADMYTSEDGGKTFNTRVVQRIHGDHHAMWINPKNSNHMILGSDGGIYFSYDRGRTWDFVSSLALGQFYEIGFDMRKPYNIYGGLQDNGSWGGPSRTWYRNGITNEDWFRVGGGDGFYTQVDPTDHTTIYVESQNGRLSRFGLNTGRSKSISPTPDDPEERYRFNWNSPILISPHDSKTIYYGGNKLFVSRDRGDTWEASQDLTTQQDRDKLPLMGVLSDRNTLSRNDGISSYGNIITVAESPLKEGLLYVGTDDGNLQVSSDGGKTWKNVIGNVPGVPKATYVSRVIASYFQEGTAYATFDGHRNDDFKSYVFVTTNYGESWKNISGNIPVGSTANVIREHHKNPNLLFVGTERGAYVSIDGGKRWVLMKGNLPMVPVDDIAIHPRDNDLIFGTHGRSIWILDDITPLERLSQEVMASDFHLFGVRTSMGYSSFNHKGSLGHKVFVAPNPPNGALISYYLKEKAKDVKVLIKNGQGKVLRELKAPEQARQPGINRITWNIRYVDPPPLITGRFARYMRVQGPRLLPGEYTVALKVEDGERAETFTVEADPRFDASFEDWKAQHDTLYKIYKLIPIIKAADNTTSSLKKKMNNVKAGLKEVPDAPEEIKSGLERIVKEIDDVRLQLFGEPRDFYRAFRRSVRGRILSLVGAIGDHVGAPSPKQMQRLEDDSTQLKELVQKINNIIEEEIPKLNQLMIESNIPHINPGAKIKLD